MRNDQINHPIIRILHLEDSRADADIVKFVLRKGNINAEVLLVENRGAYINALQSFKPDIILSDHTLPSFNSIEAIKILQDLKIDIPFILITATVSEEFAVDILKNGAFDYLLKDRLERLPIAIITALENWKATKEMQSYKYALDTSSKVVITDPDGKIITVNDNFCKITKYSREELIGQNHRIVSSGHHSKEFYKYMWDTISSGEIWTGEIKNKTKDNNYYWVNATIIPYLKNGKPYQYLAITLDITERKKVEQEKTRLQITLEKSLNEIYIFDAETFLFTYANQGALLNIGYSKIEIKKLTPIDIKPDFTRASFQKVIAPLIDNEKEKIIFFTNHQRKDGSIYPVEVHLQLVIDSTIKQFLAVILDITERNKAQSALIQSEQKFRLLSLDLDLQNNRLINAQKVSKIGSWETDLETLKMNWSLQTFNIFGLEPKEFHPTLKQFLKLIHPDDKEKVKKAFMSSMNSKETNSIEHKLLTKDGEEKEVEERWYIEFDEQGNPLKAIGTCQDITERKKAEHKLHSVTERLQLATKAANIGIWDWNIKQNQLIWDAEMFNIFNINPNNFNGSYNAWVETIHPDDLVQVSETFINALHQGTEFQSTYRIIWEDNSIHHIKSNGMVERNAVGVPFRMIGTSWDITKEKEAELNLERHNIELKKTNSELDKFVYSVSHDLRSPLTSMLGIINISLKKTIETQTKKHLGMLKKSVRKLDGFISDILHYSRNSRLEIKKEKIVVHELLNDICNNLKYIGAESRQVTFSFKIDKKTYLYSDKSRLNVVLNNVISNAIRYQNFEIPDPYVEVKLETSDTETIIWITDNGIGIEKEFHSKIFEMFYRVSEQSVGSGLGLYLVKESLDKLKGNIHVESEIGKGSIFKISIPNN